MKILYKYILLEIIKTFFIILSGIIIFIMISTFLDEIPMLLRHKPTFGMMFNYFLFKTPFLTAQATPFAFLLSILFVFSQLNRSNELTAMKSVGIDFNHLVVPVLSLALILSVMSFAMNETIVSRSFEKSKYIKDVVIEKKSKSSLQISHDLAKLGEEGKVYYIKYFDGLLGIMRGICILKVDSDFNITERLDAKEGKWEEGKWDLKTGVVRTFVDNREKTIEPFKTHELFMNGTPEDFIVKKQSADDTLSVNIFRLRKLINVLKDSGFKYQEEAVNLHLKIAFPFATFILALLGISIPFLFSTQRSIINAALGFLFTVITSFFYMGFVTIGISLGKVGVMPPMLAAWIANLIFLTLGFAALSKVRK